MTSSIKSVDRNRVVRLLAGKNGFLLGDREAERLIDFFKQNKYPIISLPKLDKPLEPWRAGLNSAQADYESQRKEYVEVRDAWLKEGIQCIVFKSAGTAPSFPYTSDNVDILVRSEHQARAIEILEELGYIWLRSTDEAKKILFRKFRMGKSVSAIHLHTWVGWDAEFHEEDSIWPRARVSDDDPKVMVPSPEDAILINASHAFYENKQFTLYDLAKLRSHWGRADLDWEYMRGVAERRGWLDGLCFALIVCAFAEKKYFGESTMSTHLKAELKKLRKQERQIQPYLKRILARETAEFPFRISFAYSKLLYYQKIMRDRHDRFGQRVSNLLHTFAWGFKQKSGMNPQPGMLVALSGIDGSGKSTQAEALDEALTISDATHKIVWSRPGCSRFYRRLTGLARRERKAAAGELPAEARLAPGGKLGRIAWTALNVLDLALVYNWEVRRRTLVGNIVVCDRYVADAEVEIQSRLRDDDRLARWLTGLLSMLSPKPDAGFLLDAPPDAAADRSADRESADALAKQRELYRSLAERRGLRVLDGDPDAEKTAETIVNTVIEEYMAEFGTLINGLMLSNPEQLNDFPRDKAAKGASV